MVIHLHPPYNCKNVLQNRGIPFSYSKPFMFPIANHIAFL